MLTKKCVLVLSHATYSFVDTICSLLKDKDIQCFILSSSNEKYDKNRETYLREISDSFIKVNNLYLQLQDVKNEIQRIARLSVEVVCCFTVWEGYRIYMSSINDLLDVEDTSIETINLLTNKYKLRKKLLDENYSSIEVEKLTPELLSQYQKNNIDKFIKPSRGISSIGTFKLNKKTKWSDIEQIVMDWEKDNIFNSIHDFDKTFIIEDYILGEEFSFEVLVFLGQIYIIAIHEKLEVNSYGNSILENSCISPPISLLDEDIYLASKWIEDILKVLNITVGLFHIEAKLYKNTWEIVEINPRIGGALISDSVKFITGGYSLLDIWLSSLILQHKNSDNFVCELSNLNILHKIYKNNNATFFRVFFCTDLGKLVEIKQNEIEIKPSKVQILAEEGTIFESSNKEHFLAQVLWTGRKKFIHANSQKLIDTSKELLSVKLEEIPKKNAFLLIDYNLTRKDEVQVIRKYVKSKYNLDLMLVREKGTVQDREISDYLIEANPLSKDFVSSAIKKINKSNYIVLGGLVFSDNAIVTGSKLLNELNLQTDSAKLAINSFDKYLYRVEEAKYKELLKEQNIFTPNFLKVRNISDLHLFIENNLNGIVIKPTTEGNNRGVIKIYNNSKKYLNDILKEESCYIEKGLIVEEIIPFKEEYSFDGIGQKYFITEKISSEGKYPIEYGQIVPATIDENIENLIVKAGNFANIITGQMNGTFHNEVLVDSVNNRASIVEPNRRPAGMKIWNLVNIVFEFNLFHYWIDSQFTNENKLSFNAKYSAMNVMLPTTSKINSKIIIPSFDILIEALKYKLLKKFSEEPLYFGEHFVVAPENKILNGPPKSGDDFIGNIIIYLDYSKENSKKLRMVFKKVQAYWANIINSFLENGEFK